MARKYLLQYAKENNARTLTSSNGEQMLEVILEGRVPRKGTIKRFALESRLNQYGYNGPMRVSSIRTWVSEQTGISPQDTQLIHTILGPFIKIKKI